VLAGIAAMGINVALSLTLPAMFSQRGWLPLGGLALANSIATGLEMILLLVLMRRRLGGMEGGSIAQAAWQAGAASAVMGLVLWLGLRNLGESAIWLQAVGGIVLGGGIYLAVIWLLKVPELADLSKAVRQRIARTG
jgi:putative peptidoglycan lipid II flippase